jgi:flagellar L-ring protein precursor FlgH
MRRVSTLAVLCGTFAMAGQKSANQPRQPSALDRYIEEASQPTPSNSQAPDSGSLWTPAARFSDLAADLRSRRVDDIVTIVVHESASAVSTGTSKTSRNSSAQSSVSALAGITKAAGPWANLAKAGTNTQLDGQGTTSRSTVLTTTVSARVTHVLLNGNLVVEGTKNVIVNSENQMITVRGVIRPIDLDTTNSVQSARLAQMEIQVNGKGIVNDAVRRPNILYRLLLGLLPF